MLRWRAAIWSKKRARSIRLEQTRGYGSRPGRWRPLMAQYVSAGVHLGVAQCRQCCSLPSALPGAGNPQAFDASPGCFTALSPPGAILYDPRFFLEAAVISMVTATRQVSTVIAFCCAGFVCSVGLSQESSEAEADLGAQATVDDEIVVRGRSRAALRMQFELAEEAVYERFNEINSSDEFDIHCRLEQETGSRIPRRVCQANFWRAAQADAGRETVLGLRGNSAFDPQLFLGEALYKRQLLAEELRRLAAEDDELRRALVRLANISQAQQARDLSLPAAASSSARETTADDGALPYDAARVAEVRIGREPWSHVLMRRTFTIAQVYGEIRSIEVDCDGRTERLQWEAGVEWTLPDDWGSCTLLVEAPPSTTFSLYEFE